MLMKRNLLENIIIISCSSTVVCALLNYVTNISPLTGCWFIAYTLFLFVISIILSVKTIQWFLRLNKPLKYDIEAVVKKYPFASFLLNSLPKVSKKVQPVECKEYDTNELSIITSVLERKLVSSWYINYISQEIGFPFACKQMLDQIISRAFQICNKIETKDVYVHICAILISHLKEYKKALKRHEKSPTISIDSLYRGVHEISDQKNKKTASADHCVNIIRVILKELVPWELWDTPYSELLVRILAKKLDIFIDTTISDPIWLNDKLLTLLTASKDIKPETTETLNDSDIKKTIIDEKQDNQLAEPTSTETIQETVINKKSELIEIIAENDKCFEAKETVPSSEPLEIKPVLRQRRGRQGKNEVKIYDRIIEGSVKTWETDMDLQCISMGQDLLASLDELTISRLWGQEDTEISPNLRASSTQPLWFGEEDAIELDSEPAKETKSSPKAADALLKDIQSTVSQAKSKIGDLQVPLHVDKRPSDEAAGMMEGLLDKGIAGIKKGLRFTGLSDDSQDKSPSHQRERGEKMSPTEVNRQRGRLEAVTEHRDIKEYTATGHKDDVTSVPPLLKQQRVTSQDSTNKVVLEPAPTQGSPEPQYEEAADLSHTIAKLRSLLSEAAPRNEEIWWEGAEETRGRTQSHSSERNVDTATLADEYDMNLERNASPGQTSNNMQRLDKLFQRTVTGVFNSLKTAVGAEGEGRPPRAWTYVCSGGDGSVGGAVARLVGARRALTHVDAALDSLQQLAPHGPRGPRGPHGVRDVRAAHPAPDDFEEWCVGHARWSGSGELLCELGLCEEHVSYRIATLLLADVAETLICSWLEDLTAWTRKQVFALFERMSEPGTEPTTTDTLREFNIDETCRIIMEKMPETYIFGEESISRALRLLLGSLSHARVNRELAFRALDLLAALGRRAARDLAFDTN